MSDELAGDAGGMVNMLREWMRAGLAKTDMSQAELAHLMTERMGKPVYASAISNLLSGRRQLSAEEAIVISDIMGEPIPGMAGEADRMMPITAKAVHGGLIIRDEQAGEATAPPGRREATRAVRIVGEALSYTMDGWIFFYDDDRSQPGEKAFGKLCVVKLTDGATVIRWLHPGKRPDRVTLTSNHAPPIEDVEIDWAECVTWIKPV